MPRQRPSASLGCQNSMLLLLRCLFPHRVRMLSTDVAQPHTPAQAASHGVATLEVAVITLAEATETAATASISHPEAVYFNLVCTEPAAKRLVGTGSTFTWRGREYRRTGVDALRVSLKAPSTMTVATLLDFCAAWLGVPGPESISVSASPGVLAPDRPTRTLAEAGFGLLDSDHRARVAPVPTYVVIPPPFCGICLGFASPGPSWTCRGSVHDRGSAHIFCEACMKRYAETSLFIGAQVMLRCPSPGCPYTMDVDEIGRLVPLDTLAAKRANNVADQQRRLASIRAGNEEESGLRELLASNVARSCPRCSVVILKNGGCHHMTCNMCGCQFDWTG